MELPSSNGEQVPELQILWMESELKRLAAAGVDLQNADLKISNGTESWTVKPIISEHGISWKVKGEK